VGEDDFFGLGSGHGFKLPTCLFFEALAIGSLPQFLPLYRLVGYFCRAGLGSGLLLMKSFKALISFSFNSDIIFSSCKYLFYFINYSANTFSQFI
jgi:hypothetical protein